MVLLLAFIVTCFVFTAQPVFSQAGDHDFSGTLTEINKENMTITIQSSEETTKTFQLSNTTLISLDAQPASLNDLSTGAEIIVFYYLIPGDGIEVASVSAKTAD